MFEIVTQPHLLIGGKLAFVNQKDLIARQLQQQFVIEAVEFLFRLHYALLDFFQQMARQAWRSLLLADQDAAFKVGKAYLVKLIKVIGIDPQKTHTFDQRVGFIGRFL